MLPLLLLTVLSPTPAHPSPWAEHSLGVELGTGLGAPAGAASIGLDWTPLPWLSLGGGIGAGRSFDLFSESGGFQAAFMPRLRFVVAGWGVSMGAGPSLGSFEWCDSCPFEGGDRWQWSRAFWLNVEGGLEYRWRSGVGVRFSLGTARLENPDAVTCSPTKYQCLDMPPVQKSAQPYGGFSVRIPLWGSHAIENPAGP
jgi:hypothetical protein